MALKIYTKKGDKGKTSLFGGTKLSKNDIRIEAYGTIDELNSFIGLLRDSVKDEKLISFLLSIQDNLFNIGSNLAVEDPGKYNMPSVTAEDVDSLEKAIDEMDAYLPKLKYFILPGGHQLSSFCHLARVVCRRAERRVVALDEVHEVDPLILTYLNRLSDYLFVLARDILHSEKVEEVYWKPDRSK